MRPVNEKPGGRKAGLAIVTLPRDAMRGAVGSTSSGCRTRLPQHRQTSSPQEKTSFDPNDIMPAT